MSSSRFTTPRDKNGRTTAAPYTSSKPLPGVGDRKKPGTQPPAKQVPSKKSGLKKAKQTSLDNKNKVDNKGVRRSQSEERPDVKSHGSAASFNSDYTRHHTPASPEPSHIHVPVSRTASRESLTGDSHNNKTGSSASSANSDYNRHHSRASPEPSHLTVRGGKKGSGAKSNGHKHKEGKRKSRTSGSVSSGSSDSSEDRPRARSPIQCQCSCHDQNGRRRSILVRRKSSGDSIERRFGKDPFSDDARSRSHSRTRSNSLSSNGSRNSKNNKKNTKNNKGKTQNNNASDSDDNGKKPKPPINIKDTKKNKTAKGTPKKSANDRPSKYKAREDSKTSHLSVTSVSSRTSPNKDKPAFRFHGRSSSAGAISHTRSMGSARPSEYDYAHEDFLTDGYTSEYQARYEMRMGQRYKVKDDKSIHYIDPAGEHVLVPKTGGQTHPPPAPRPLQRRLSDSDIPTTSASYPFAKNNKNVKLEPLDNKGSNPKPAAATNTNKKSNANPVAAPKWNGNWSYPQQAGVPKAESVATVTPKGAAAPAKRSSVHSLPPMTHKTPSKDSADLHPLGLGSPPRRRSQLQPLS